MKPENYHQPLIPDNTYHLFSRAVGSEQLFKTDENYFFFLNKLKQHTDPVCQLYTYSLLPNHFHLLGRIRSASEIESAFHQAKKKVFDENLHSLSDFIMERFSNLLNSYTKSFNKIHHRKGSLFIDYLKRSLIKDDGDLASLIWYIHKNAIHHGYTNSIGEWRFDGYKDLLSNAPTAMLKSEAIEFYGSMEHFVQVHQQPVFVKNVVLDFH
jgi:REP element-mobilizing transposase RayT